MDRAADAAPAATPVGPGAPARAARGKVVRLAAIGLVVAGIAVGGFAYWRHSLHYATTDNAYVNANTVDVAAQVAGQVTAVHVQDQQAVTAGDPLFDIDPRAYEAAVAKAQAQLALARQNAQEQSAAVMAAQAELAQRQAELVNAKSNDWRTQQLVASGFYSKQGGVTARTQAQQAQAAVRAAEANVARAQSALGQSGEQNAAVQAAEATLAQAQLDLDHTHVRAPVTGVIANLSLRPGNTVTPGTPLFAVVGTEVFWVDANFKETELARIRTGQPVKVIVDMYPKHPFDGVVESVSAGSGTAFSLLPPQNATGNWVKVTQRVPVRVRITHPDPGHPLRIGTTAKVEVDLTAEERPQKASLAPVDDVAPASGLVQPVRQRQVTRPPSGGPAAAAGQRNARTGAGPPPVARWADAARPLLS